MPFRTLLNAVSAKIKHDEEQLKMQWMVGRFIASAMSKDASKVKFPWERSDESGKPSVEKIKEIKARYESYINSRKCSG